MNKLSSSLILFAMLLFLQGNIALAWDNQITHKDISEYAAESSVLNGNYLKYLGINPGLKGELTWGGKTQTIRKWLREGAELEDTGSSLDAVTGKARFTNHFHDPLKPWAIAGLTDLQSGESALVWAQDSDKQKIALAGDWSWKTIRDFFYSALTSTSDNNRQVNFAQTFIGLGYQMHLLEDMAVPAHVRNDAHPLDALIGTNGNGYYFETWTKKKIKNLNDIKTFAPNPVTTQLVFSAPTDTSVTIVLAPIANLFDTNQYDGTNPSTANTIGLAEYTNANYFSDDTISMPGIWATGDHTFPYPNASSTNLQDYIYSGAVPTTVIAEDGVQDLGFWIQKIGDEPIVHFAKPGYLTTPLYKTLGGGSVYERTFFLDDECHKDYAEKLLPRAVGYAAGLLNYFFRGSIDIAASESGFYALAKQSDSGFATIKLLALNTTDNGDEMLNGSIELVVKYQPTQDAAFVYQVVSEATAARTIPKDNPAELTFNLSSAIPITATDVTLQIVYHGRLGNEDGAVAIGFNNISEPTPIDIYNNMDKICLGGSWYDAGTQAAKDQADYLGNQNGIADEADIYPHNVKTVYVKISPAWNPQWASDTVYDLVASNVTPTTLARPAYILAEVEPEGVPDFYYSLYDIPEKTIDSPDTWGHSGRLYQFPGIAVQNQVDYVEDPDQCDGEPSCTVRQSSSYYTFRGTQMWWGGGLIYTNVPYPTDSQCSIDAL